jgi:hypothetical protein
VFEHELDFPLGGRVGLAKLKLGHRNNHVAESLALIAGSFPRKSRQGMPRHLASNDESAIGLFPVAREPFSILSDHDPFRP